MSNFFQRSASSLAARFKAATTPKRASAPLPASESLAQDQPPDGVLANARERGTNMVLLRLLQATIIVNLLIAGGLWVLTQVEARQPLRGFRVSGDLRTAVAGDFSASERNWKVDDLIAFLHLILGLRNNIGGDGTPYLALIQGLVSADLYTQTELDFKRNGPEMIRRGIAQTLILRNVTDIEVDPQNTRQISAYVVGKLYLQAARTKSGTPLAKEVEYRALCVIEQLPRNSLNPHGFYVVRITEKTGDEALKFDEQMEASRAKRRGK